jgi:excisionase family DNA binding protein
MDRLAYRLEEAATELRVTERTVRRLVKAGHLHAIPNMGTRVVIAAAELERFINSGVRS